MLFVKARSHEAGIMVNKEAAVNRTDMLVEGCKLHNFILNNQLVQAHAVAQKMESSIQQAMVKDTPEGTKVEDHKWWDAFICIVKVKSRILSGKRDEAQKETDEAIRILKEN